MVSLQSEKEIADFQGSDEYSTAVQSYLFTSSLPETKPILLVEKKKSETTSNEKQVDSGKNREVDSLASRITKLEKEIYEIDEHHSDASTRRARQYIESTLLQQTPPRFISSVSWKWVPENYYSLTLQQRAGILKAHSTNQLCKSMLMENRAPNAPKDCGDRTNARFYLVVVQYDATINTKKLESEIRGLRSVQSGKRLDKSDFEFRMAGEDDNDRVTGYSHNSVTPFGLLDSSVPIVLSKSILDVSPAFMWMGGGHVHLKLGMAVREFVQALDALVLDASDFR